MSWLARVRVLVTVSVALAGCEAAPPLEPACSDGWFDLRRGIWADPGVDMLLVVDPSASLERERDSMLRALTRGLRATASGDRDEDGLQDFAPPRSIRVAVVSSDLGAGALHTSAAVAGCAPGAGAAGVFRTAGDTSRPGCAATHPAVHEFFRGDDIEAFIESIACVVSAVRAGCGVEQPLEAALVALSPAAPNDAVPADYVPPVFAAGLVPQGDAANAGFLRRDSALHIMFVTDEDDASLAVPRLDDGGASLDVASGDPVLGEVGLGRALLPIERYVDGFLALRENPALVLVASVGGVPVDLTPPPGISSGDLVAGYDQMLADARMIESLDPAAAEARLRVTCITAEGVLGFPARRFALVLRGLELRGAGTTMLSICSDDFRPAFDRIVGLIGSSLGGGTCLPRRLAVDSEGRVDCVVEETLSSDVAGRFVTRCSDLPGATWIGVALDERGSEHERCEIRRLGLGELAPGSTASGWFYDTSDLTVAMCGPIHPPGQRISFLNHVPPEDSLFELRCHSPMPASVEDGGAALAACDL